MNSKLDVPPLSGHAGISPATQIVAILYKIIRRSRGRQSALAEIGTFHSLCHRPLCASYATTRRNRTVQPSSSALIFSPPCGSHPEYAHSVYKNVLKEYPFGCGCPARNCNKVAISLAQSANITVAIGNNITHTLRAYHLHCRCGSESVFEQAHTVYKNAPNRLKSSATVRRTISR